MAELDVDHRIGYTPPLPETIVGAMRRCLGRHDALDLAGMLGVDEPSDPVEIRPGEVPVFWACGVTPQAALMASRPPFAITHAPGYMFISDIPETHWQV